MGGGGSKSLVFLRRRGLCLYEQFECNLGAIGTLTAHGRCVVIEEIDEHFGSAMPMNDQLNN